MRHDRPGDWLWHEWDGDWQGGEVVYATFGEVDITDDLVRRAFASALQRDGVAESLGDGYKILSTANIVSGFSGIIDGEDYRIICNSDGETELGDLVNKDTKDITTWVEL